MATVAAAVVEHRDRSGRLEWELSAGRSSPPLRVKHGRIEARRGCEGGTANRRELGDTPHDHRLRACVTALALCFASGRCDSDAIPPIRSRKFVPSIVLLLLLYVLSLAPLCRGGPVALLAALVHTAARRELIAPPHTHCSPLRPTHQCPRFLAASRAARRTAALLASLPNDRERTRAPPHAALLLPSPLLSLAMESLLDFSKPLDVNLLDQAVHAFFIEGNPQVAHTSTAQQPPRAIRTTEARSESARREGTSGSGGNGGTDTRCKRNPRIEREADPPTATRLHADSRSSICRRGETGRFDFRHMRSSAAAIRATSAACGSFERTAAFESASATVAHQPLRCVSSFVCRAGWQLCDRLPESS